MSNQAASGTKYKFVKYLWKDDEADRLEGVDRLVYRSNKLGEDLTLTNTGGGNTSSKLSEKDPLSGETVEVLWLKGSGGDLENGEKRWLCVALSGQSPFNEADLSELAREWSQDADRGRDVPDVFALCL